MVRQMHTAGTTAAYGLQDLVSLIQNLIINQHFFRDALAGVSCQGVIEKVFSDYAST